MIVRVGKFGDTASDISLNDGATVEDALRARGIAYNDERILVNGEEANLEDELEQGDVVNIVTSKGAA